MQICNNEKVQKNVATTKKYKKNVATTKKYKKMLQILFWFQFSDYPPIWIPELLWAVLEINWMEPLLNER